MVNLVSSTPASARYSTNIATLQLSTSCSTVRMPYFLKCKKPRPIDRDYLVWQQEAFEPIEQLPSEYIIPSKLKEPCGLPPQLHYGLSVSFDALLNYAIERCLLSAELITDDTERYFVSTAIAHLGQLCGARLSLQAPLWTAEEEWMISRYSNYSHSFIYTKTDPPDNKVFAIICRELAITALPRWYRVM